MSKKTLRILTFCFFLSVFASRAQDTVLAEPQRVEVAAEDGLMLVGDFYALATDTDVELPTVLLMHQNQSNRQSWEPLIGPLLEAGFNVLTVDLRAHGETGGARDWEAALEDVQTWLDWLREQPTVRDSGIATVGASIGSNLALVGCANDPTCVTAIALSPGVDYFGIQKHLAVCHGRDRGDWGACLPAGGTRDEYVRQRRGRAFDYPDYRVVGNQSGVGRR
jgi:pimeloyl-ACP methyl ester carboxylesterase